MRVIETSLSEDLSLFSSYLWQQRIVHRIFEESGSQVLELSDAAHADSVRAAYRAWQDGRLTIEAVPGKPVRAGWTAALLRYPGLTALIALVLAVFPFSYLMAEGRVTVIAAWLTIIDLRLAGDALPTALELLRQGEVWRWFTPMLLHFSVLHLGFNCAITIELGRRLEGALGTAGFWLLVLTLAAVSNLCQYAFGAGPLFGGLSGVAYGLLGFILVMARRVPGMSAWQLPRGLSIGLLVFLVVFTTGVTEPFGLFVANAAHWSGLAGGAVLAALWRQPTRD